MNNSRYKSSVLALLLAVVLGSTSLFAAYYKESPLFHYHPGEESPREVVGRLGPIGLGLELLQPAFTMRILSVEPGSPADKTGKLQKGQYIESINGQVLKDIDPRVILGNLITEAEAKDGKIVLMIKDTPDAEATPVVVQIPALGAYSPTWPDNCPKSDKIVRQFAEYLAASENQGWGAALFLLSTGEEQDLEVVRNWFSGKLSTNNPGFPWSIGYNDTAICEYYLRTGDKSVLPALQSKADYLKSTIYNGSWMGRGGANFKYMAGGHMNAAGVHSLTFLLMAKECGVDVDEHTLLTALKQFYRYVGHGVVPYGDAYPEGGFTDNGRVAKLAFAMQAAANLTPEGEDSVYAKARDISATKSFYSTSWLFHGHTGGGIGELWRGAAMGLLKDKRPLQYRSFMDERRWMYELARTHDGAFGWADGQNISYTGVNTGKPNGNYIPLIYTLPRKKLRMFGAPPTQFSQSYSLPQRPWGTPADDAFFALEAGEITPGIRFDVSKETIRNGASRAIIDTLKNPETTVETIMQYALHIDQTNRDGAAARLMERTGTAKILELLASKDPRGRHAAAKALASLNEPLTNDMVSLLGNMVKDPQEAWWGVQQALKTLGKASADQLAPYVSDIAKWLEPDDWWMRAAALEAIAPLAADKRFCQQLLPRIGEVMTQSTSPGMLRPFAALVERVKEADPEVLSLALETLQKTYAGFPSMIAAPGGQNMSNGTEYMLRHIASAIASTPGGFDTLYRVSKQRFPSETLPHLDLYMQADVDRFSPELKTAFEPIIRDQIIWNYVGNNLNALEREINAGLPDRAVDGLVDLYRKVGTKDYDWMLWGPHRDKIEWHYTSYDPKEERLWQRGGESGGRYRPISWPEGSENWMQPGFDPDKAGWQKGLAPFAHKDGKLAPTGGCIGHDHFCGCGNPPNTFWEKEVLLMRADLKLPPAQPGYAYRFLVGGRSHVGGGDGSDVWFNGKRKEGRGNDAPSLTGVGKRAGGRPWGFVLDDKFRSMFTSDTVTIATSGFLPIHKSGIKKNYQTFWFEQMKLPTLGTEEMLAVLRATPLMTSAWQTSLEDTDKFQFKGSFEPNPAILGSWKLIAKVARMDDFDPAIRLHPVRNAPFQNLSFLDQGRTSNLKIMYSGDLLLDLTTRQALKMTTRNIGDTQYLFLEAGGFKEDQIGDWQTEYYIMQQAN